MNHQFTKLAKAANALSEVKTALTKLALKDNITMRRTYVKNAATLPIIGQLRSAMDEMDDSERKVVMQQLETILNSQPQGDAE
ncbi:hypothetical protein AU658_001342 [Salmonella enterica subsp. enterica]|uniref:Uncharacterized protein n=1 Tax=Salmonella enterica I TaxID=59201 RepID=A0A3Y3RTD1_SALET|nr:hypothetical protein [Salmonella enterica]EAA8258253.1 hypothetical protein [Salmonella enterica subsp. enterica]EAA9401465.1 hypothetical protein [Salmonella enterica subsp. enterica serovar 4,5,12:b:-]EBQ9391890.1 hypothetical protein [Salmonella enterica subsp. enterica serovar Javiana]EBS4936836.1 hypothetical protein [Salmonella enterica subsp. enterica serovar Goverdhan]EBV5391662.1 hypothetical protein [Salmonella enterica subsp. enterica serovar Tananarive]EDB4173572.1 hypothetical